MTEQAKRLRGPESLGRDKRLMLYLNTEEYDALRTYARREGISLAAAARRGLRLLEKAG